MRRRLWVLLAITLAFALAAFLYMHLPSAHLDIPIDMPGDGRILIQASEEDGGLSWEVMPGRNGQGFIRFRGDMRERETFRVQSEGMDGGEARTIVLEKNPFLGMVDASTGNFTGFRGVVLAVSGFLTALTTVLILAFRDQIRHRFYTYHTIYCAGFGVFCFATCLLFLGQTLKMFLSPETFSMVQMYSYLISAPQRFMLITMPFLVIFSLLMMISNVFLLRREGKRFHNMLGILLSVLMLAGLYPGIFLGDGLEGLEGDVRWFETWECVYCTFYLYFECMLLGAVACGIMAVKYPERLENSCVLILGSQTFSGRVPPLLAGRLDRAMEFGRRRREEGYGETLYIPCGGQGSHETEPEAESMKRYLLEHGIPDEQILVENTSRNTYENMVNAGKLLKERGYEGDVTFATNNYHLFRSGVWAWRAGLRASGVGSRTRWYFWPNAFVREFLSLLLAEPVRHTVLLLFFLGYFFTLSRML